MPGDDDKKTQSDPVDDLKKGIGLLFRAAKSAVDQLPTEKLEQVVVSGVKEVGRAIENVTDQIDRQIFHGKGTIPHPEDAKPAAPPADAAAAPQAASATPPDAAHPPADAKKDDPPADDKPAPDDDAPRGPRVA
jgi:hypothetical protein